ncbi:MAG TPA: hypothetical protein VFZ61_16085, partial [Polyangiales bacterium]
AFASVGASERFGAAVVRAQQVFGAMRAPTQRELRSIRAPILLVNGEHGMIRPQHVDRMARLLRHARLEVLPGDDHDPSIVTRSARLVPEFLDAPLAV